MKAKPHTAQERGRAAAIVVMHTATGYQLDGYRVAPIDFVDFYVVKPHPSEPIRRRNPA